MWSHDCALFPLVLNKDLIMTHSLEFPVTSDNVWLTQKLDVTSSQGLLALTKVIQR